MSGRERIFAFRANSSQNRRQLRTSRLWIRCDEVSRIQRGVLSLKCVKTVLRDEEKVSCFLALIQISDLCVRRIKYVPGYVRRG